MGSDGAAAGRWWVPGVLAGLLAGLVSALLAAGWQAYEAGGCGSGTDGFACLGAFLMGLVGAVVLGPFALWLVFRALGVRHPVLAVPVTAVVALCLLAVPELLHQVALGLGRQGPPPVPVPVAAGVLLGSAAAAGGLALQGPRRRARGAVAGVLLAALATVVLAQQPATEEAETRLELADATVPLLLPDGYEVFDPDVGADGGLEYHAVLTGSAGYGYEGVRVEVSADTSRFGETCSFRACTDDGDVRVEVGQTGDGYGSQGWRVVDGTLVTVTTGSSDAPADLVGLLRGLRAVGVEEVLDRRYVEPD